MASTARRGSSRSSSRPAAPPPAPALLYAVGDVHGHLALLTALWAKIERDAKRNLPAGGKAKVVFLGDYIDRGPDSRGVLRWLNQLRLDPPAWCEPVFLIGNHEVMMLDYLGSSDAESFSHWALNGGAETLESFGVTGTAPTAVAKLARAALFPEFADFFKATKFFHPEPGFLFVHAGVRPGVPLVAQRAEDLVWIREEFLDSEADHGFRVVHGHTPTSDRKVELRPNRINVDTHAYRSGVLSAVALGGERVRVLQTGGARG